MMGIAMCVSDSIIKAIFLSTSCYGMPNLVINISLKRDLILVELCQSHDVTNI